MADPCAAGSAPESDADLDDAGVSAAPDTLWVEIAPSKERRLRAPPGLRDAAPTRSIRLAERAIGTGAGVRVYSASGATGMRKGIVGLHSPAQVD